MINKIITTLIVKLVNIRYAGKLFRLIREIESTYKKRNRPNREQAMKEYLNSWGIDKKSILEIEPISKADIRKYNERVDKSKVHKTFYTGGSTGEPLKLLYSRQRAVLRTASVLYYNNLGGYEIGDRYLFIRSKPKSKLFQFLRNEILFIPNDFSSKRINELASTMIKKEVKAIIGYPSVIYEIALFLKDKPNLSKGLKIRTFISGAEPLDPYVRNTIKSVLNCNVIDRYSNEENGLIAQQHEFTGDLIVDRFNLYVEVVNPETLLPVKTGEIGKVLVTDLYSDLVPMIRYDTGDYATVSEYRDGELYSLKDIKGRIIDQFITTNGIRFSPLILGPHIRIPLTDLNFQVQFQLTQNTKTKFTLKFKAKCDKIPQKKIIEVIEGLKTVLGMDAKIHIQFVDDIPSLPSGKRPLYRNLLIKLQN